MDQIGRGGSSILTTFPVYSMVSTIDSGLLKYLSHSTDPERALLSVFLFRQLIATVIGTNSLYIANVADN
jgi:hypothetical protein